MSVAVALAVPVTVILSACLPRQPTSTRLSRQALPVWWAWVTQKNWTPSNDRVQFWYWGQPQRLGRPSLESVGHQALAQFVGEFLVQIPAIAGREFLGNSVRDSHAFSNGQTVAHFTQHD